MRVDHDRSRDPFAGCCPAHGDCWEGLASGPAIAARFQTPPEDLPVGHPAWELEADYLAAGILNIILVASPERFVVGGGVLENPSMLGLVRSRVVDLLAGYLDAPELTRAGIEAYLVPPALGDDAGVLGAIALAQALTA